MQKKRALRFSVVAAMAMTGIFTRCDCPDDLRAVPKPEIEVIDVETGKTNAEAAEADEPFVVDFGAVDIGVAQVRQIRIKNLGDMSLTIDTLRLVEEGLDPEVCSGAHRGFTYDNQPITPLSIDLKDEKEIGIRFTPTTAGPHCFGLMIKSDDEDEGEILVYLTAGGSGGRLCPVPFDATTVEFGPVFIGDTGRKTVDFENCGNRAIQITEVLMHEDPEGVFGIDTVLTLPLPLEPGAGFTVDFTFGPTNVREYRGALAGRVKMVTGQPYEAEQFITLEGTGAERPRCKITAVPTTLSFGAVAGNAGTVDRTMLLKNNGECHCEITAISDVVMDEQAAAPNDGVFSVHNPPAMPFYLMGSDPSAEGCDDTGSPTSSTETLTIRYTLPSRTQPALERGHFDVTSNDPVNDPLTVSIEANGGGVPYCQLEVTPEAPDQPNIGPGGFDFESKTLTERWSLIRFGNVNLHFERFQPVTFENVGNYNCVINEVRWKQPWTPDNEFGFADENQVAMTLPATGLGKVIAPGASLSLYATFKPTHTVEGSIFPNMKCLSGGYCAALSNAMGNETCLNSPCVWGNGVDIVTGDGVDPLTADTTTDQSLVGDSAVAGTFSVGFMGKPTTPAIDVIPSDIDFGLITVGCGSQERTINVYNTGNGDLVVTRLDIIPAANPDEFRVTASMVPPDYTVAPGGTPMPINVRFFPRREGEHLADLIIYALEGTTEVPMFTVPLRGEGTLETHATDVFRQLMDPMVDVLWVVDDSGSMSGEQDTLGNNFPSFFGSTTINNVDYHIAVTTTLTRDSCVPDFSNPQDSCAGTPPDPMAGYYTSCSGNDKWITPSSVDAENQFTCNVKVSDGDKVNPDRPSSDSAEGGLMAAKYFLSPPNIDDPAINGGFLRDDAKLYVIAVSDEEDQSDGPTDLYVDFFRNLKGFRNTGLVNFSAIAGDVPNGCGTDEEGASSGARYKDVADAMGGLFHSICAPDWTSMLQSLAFDSFGLKIQFFLSRGAASAADIEVCVHDQDLTGVTGACPGTVVPMRVEGDADGWFYDAGSNSIVFNPGSVPERGHWIRADYDTACLPLQP